MFWKCCKEESNNNQKEVKKVEENPVPKQPSVDLWKVRPANQQTDYKNGYDTQKAGEEELAAYRKELKKESTVKTIATVAMCCTIS